MRSALFHIRVYRSLHAEQPVALHKGMAVYGFPYKKLGHSPFVAVVAGAGPEVCRAPLEAQGHDGAYRILCVDRHICPGIGGSARSAFGVLEAISRYICPVNEHGFCRHLADVFTQGSQCTYLRLKAIVAHL